MNIHFIKGFLKTAKKEELSEDEIQEYMFRPQVDPSWDEDKDNEYPVGSPILMDDSQASQFQRY